MKYVQSYEPFFKNKKVHEKLLFYLFNNKSPFIFSLDKKNDTIHYIIFGKKVKFVQIIFQKQNWCQYNNFDILEYGLKRKKIAKNYLLEIDEICQYNFILFENTNQFDLKYWAFKDENHEFHDTYYMVYILNLYWILKKTNSKYKNICELLKDLFHNEL